MGRNKLDGQLLPSAQRQANSHADKTALEPSDLIERAHAKGLQVHAYTFRNESRRLLSNYHNNPILEYQAFYNLGLDGLFTDFTDTALLAR